MKKKLIGSFFVASCMLPATVMATDVNIEQNEDVVNSVTLQFNSQSGTECASITLPISSEAVTYTLPTPMKAGHAFLGWFTNENVEITEDNVFDAFSTLESGETTTVKAKWEKQEPATVTSSITTEKIEDSEYYYDVIQKTENFADGSKITTNTKTKKIEGFVVEEQTITTYYNQDGSTTQEGTVIMKGDDEYKRAKAKNDLTITVLDSNGNPVQGFKINFKTTEEDINLTTDENGKIVHYFKPGTYETKIVKVPDGYTSNTPVEKFGLGKMYSISYIENYVLDIVEIRESPIKEEDKTESNKENVNQNKNEQKNKKKEENIIIKEETKDNPSQTVIEEKKEDEETIIISNNNSNTNTTIISENTPLSATANIQENKDFNHTEIIKSPQTGDNNSFLFVGLLPISILGMFASMKKNKK